MRKIFASENYPFVKIDLEIDNFKLKEEALADTGAESHGVYIPENGFDIKQVKQNITYVEIQTGDGKTHYWKSYLGKVKINNKEFITSVVIGTDKIILGRDVLDKVVSIFDGPHKKLILKEL